MLIRGRKGKEMDSATSHLACIASFGQRDSSRGIGKADLTFPPPPQSSIYNLIDMEEILGCSARKSIAAKKDFLRAKI